MASASITDVSLGKLIDDGVIQIATGFPFGGHNNDGDGVPHIRPFNVGTDGDVHLDQIKSIPASAATGKPQLQQRDILFNNTNTKELVGKCALWLSESSYVFSNHMTRIRILRDSLDPAYLSFAILYHWMSGKSEMLARSHVAQASIIGARFCEIEVPLFPIVEQRSISHLIEQVRIASRSETAQLEHAQELKQATMRELFTRGLRGEAQKETEIGLVPASWNVERLDRLARTISTRMAYSDLEKSDNDTQSAIKVLGIKVSDMNRIGNETVIMEAALEKTLPKEVAEYRCAPPNTIVFPKRGAAIATNKKRMTSTWTVFDPNVIGVVPVSINSDFLFHWFQLFDLRTITEPGPTPQLNKKHLDPLLIPVPPMAKEQEDIAEIFDAIDRKIALHRSKRAVLEELFKSLLHKLMTGEIRVSELNLSALSTPSSNGAIL